MPKGADEIFKDLREHSIAEFFRKNKQMLGYSGKIKSLTTVVHELVTNSLDACEESKVLPDLFVKIEQPGDDLVVVHERDNGPGIPEKHISSVFGKMLAGTKFHRHVQLRGQQGIGVAGVTMFSQMTTGKPVEIISVTRNEAYDIELMVDIRKNKADIINKQKIDPLPEETGVEYVAKFKDVQFSTGDQGPYEYLRRTALANPHTQITYVDPSGARVEFPRTAQEIPKPPKETQPHPKGVIVEDLVLMGKRSVARSIKSMLQQELTRFSAGKGKELQELVNFDLGMKPKKMGWTEAEQIVKAFKKMKFLAPATDCLRPIGGAKIEEAMKSILAPEFLSVIERKPNVYGGGYPFQIEVAVAYGGHAGRKLNSGETRMEIMRFANRVPLLFDTGGCGLTKAVQSVDWKRYGLRDLENSPVSIFVNLISTHIPYTSAGKQSVADEDEIVDEIRFALMELGRKFKRFHSGKRKAKEHAIRRDKLLRYVSEIVPAISELTGRDKEKIREKWEQLIEDKIGVLPQEEEDVEGEEGAKTVQKSPSEESGEIEEEEDQVDEVTDDAPEEGDEENEEKPVPRFDRKIVDYF